MLRSRAHAKNVAVETTHVLILCFGFSLTSMTVFAEGQITTRFSLMMMALLVAVVMMFHADDNGGGDYVARYGDVGNGDGGNGNGDLAMAIMTRL